MNKYPFQSFPSNIFKYTILTYILFSILPFASAQQYKMFNGNIYTCSGKITDSGGATGNYGKNEKFTTVICSDNPQYSLLQLAFGASDIKNGDDLCIYDGINTNYPLLTCSSEHNNFPFVVQTTKSNPAGCLTLQFISDNFIQGTGFSADISCKPVCQDIMASIASSVMTQDSTIDICSGESVTLKPNAVFPQNNQKYHQDLSNCSFEWYLDNKLVSAADSFMAPIFNEGGHTVNLLITDSLGCKSQNLALEKIRVAPKPKFIEGNFKKTICNGEELEISTSIPLDTKFDLTLQEQYASFPKEDFVIDSLALPDGTGQSFSSVLFIGRFNPNEIIDDPDDLDKVCITIEHSFLNDLEISLTCPNGQKIILQKQSQKTGIVYLGEPVDDDELLPEPIPGKGYEYCWKMNAPNGTWNDYVLKNSPKTLPSGVYAPYQSFDNLYGCPMDGLWTINVNDLWNSDNGYVFYWSMQFNPDLYPPVDSFTNNISTGQWLPNQTILNQSGNNLSTIGLTPGLITQVWEVKDDAGCTFQYPVDIEVLPDLNPTCKNCKLDLIQQPDQIVCSGDQVILNADVNPAGFITHTNFAAMSSELNRDSDTSDFIIPVSFYNYPSSANIEDLINSVCLTASSSDFAKVELSLVSPDLKEITLIAKNTINSGSISKTCFVPSSTVPLNTGSGSYTGDFMSSQSFNLLQNCSVKGDWKIQVNKPKNDYFILTEANVDFKIINNLHFQWKANNLYLNCDTCKAVPVDVTQADKVKLMVFDDYVCVDSTTIDLNIQSSFAAPIVSYQVISSGTILFTWTPVPGASTYEISLNGQAWTIPNGNFSHIVSNLTPGAEVTFKVRVDSKSKNCQNEIGTVVVSLNDCGMMSLLEITPESCLGSKDGIIKINVTNGTSPYTFILNGSAPTSNSTFQNLSSGSYEIIIIDSKACRDTITTDIQTAIPISIDKVVKDVSCFGLSDGSITMDVYGGFAPISFNWSQGNTQTNVAEFLKSGNYFVTITDGKKCSVTESIYISQPSELSSNPKIDKPTCFGLFNASIDLQTTGGTLPYNFLWADGSNFSSKNGINAGNYQVTITDSHGCSLDKNIIIDEPLPLSFGVNFSNPDCFGYNNGWLKINASGGTLPYTYSLSGNPGNNSDFQNNLSAGTYQVTITDAQACEAIGTFTLTDPPVLNASPIIEDEKCPNQNNGKIDLKINSGNGPFTFNWGNGINGSGSSVTNIAPGNYTVTITNVNGCSQELPLTVNPALPFSGYIDAPLIDCQSNADGVATVVITSGLPPFTYQWNDAQNQTGSQATSLISGLYSVSVTDSRSCLLTLDVQINSKDPIKISKNIITDASCDNKSDGSIDLSFTGGTLPYNIDWSNGLPSGNFNQQNLASGKYQYTLTDNAGCKLNGELIINAPQKITANVKITNVACKYEKTGMVETQISGGTLPYNLSWSNGSNTLNIQNLAAGNYTLTITDKNNCDYIQLYNIKEPNQEFIIEATQKLISCYGENQSSAELLMISGSGSIVQSIWSNNMTSSLIDQLSNGIYTVTATDSYGCAKTASVNITDWQPLIVDYKIDETKCAESTDGKITINSINGGAGSNNLNNYLVSWNQQVPSIGNLVASNLSGGQAVTISVYDMQGCQTTSSVIFPMTPPIEYSLDQKQPTCFNGNDGSILIANVKGGTAPYSYQWNTGVSGQTLNNLKSGLYICTISDANSCIQTISEKIEDPAEIKIVSTSTEPVCEYDTNGSLQVDVIGGSAPYIYLWSNGKSSSNLVDLSSGTYMLTVTDFLGCKSTKLFELNSLDKVKATVELLSAACFDQKIGAITIDVLEGLAPFEYSINGQDFSNDNYFDKLGSGNYVATIKDSYGCKEQVTFEISSSANFDIQEMSDVTIEYGQSIELKPDISQTGPVSFKWNTINVAKTNCDTCKIIEILPSQSGYIWLNVKDEQGCGKLLKFNVRIIKDYHVYVPTGFSPNADGVNDFLSIFAKDNIIVQDFVVFDQWGELIYQNNDPEINNDSKGWDGTFKGKPLNTGVFVWMLKAKFPDGTSEILSGETTLLK